MTSDQPFLPSMKCHNVHATPSRYSHVIFLGWLMIYR